MTSLRFPDLNVWVALNHAIHRHHQAALSWFKGLDNQDALVFCRQTQIGLFRLLTTEALMGDDALTQRQCWILYRKWMAGGRAFMQTEPAGLEEAFHSRTMKEESSPKEWADAYLAAFAEAAHLTLVTFDRALAGKARDSVLLS